MMTCLIRGMREQTWVVSELNTDRVGFQVFDHVRVLVKKDLVRHRRRHQSRLYCKSVRETRRNARVIVDCRQTGIARTGVLRDVVIRRW